MSLTDATGRSTTFDYGLSAQPLLVTQITDPFGRSATLTYDSMGRLKSITDVLGLTSSFSYDASSLVNAMTTPLWDDKLCLIGETAGSLPDLSRFVQATDPLEHTERLKLRHQAPDIPFSDLRHRAPGYGLRIVCCGIGTHFTGDRMPTTLQRGFIRRPGTSIGFIFQPQHHGSTRLKP